MKQKRYTQEFKETIVELYRTGTTVKELSSEYGMTEVTIYSWIKKNTPITEREDLTLTDIKKIQKENFRLKQELEILKKAMTIFARK